MIQQSLFKNYFVGRDGFLWWIGQIADSNVWKSNIPGYPVNGNSEIGGYGERYKVRIMGYHTAQPNNLPDEQLPWATVMYPVTAGGGPGASFQSANLTQGTFVFGFFLDGDDAQQPVIMGALGYNDYNQVMSGIPDVSFIPFTGYSQGEGVAVTAVRAERGSTAGDQKAPLATTGGRTDVSAVRIESTTGGNSLREQASTEAAEDGKVPEPLASPQRCRTTGGELQLTLRNAIQDIEKTKKSVYKWQYGLAEKAAKKEEEIQKKIAKFTKKIMKWFKDILNNAQRDTAAFLNRTQKQFHDLLFPSDREKLKKSVETANDLIACLFKKIFANLGQFIFDFLQGATDKIINVASCVVDNLVGGILGQISSILDSIIKQAFGTFNAIIGGAASLAGEALGIAGAALEIIIRAVSLITCDEEPTCPAIDSWSIWDGEAGITDIPEDVENLIQRITSFSGKVTDTIEGAVNLDNLNFDIDIDGLFDLNNCFTGPRSCGPPTLQIFGGGTDAAVNLIISQGGSVIGADIVNAGIGYLADAVTGKVYDDCGKGNGAVVEVIAGDITLEDGSITTGIVDIQIIEGGTGYLPSPDGSVGGDGRTWADNNETIVQHSNGDYETPIPPGNVVCVVAGDIVTLPVGSTAITESNSDVGGGETIFGGKPYTMKNAGCFTSPEVNYEKLAALYPTDATGAYPAILYLCHIDIQNSGINYSPTDKVVIEPSNGAEASVTFDSLGKVTGIKVTKGGEGFLELPDVYIETETGINAILLPRLCIDRIGEDVEKPVTGGLVSVVDCVGKF
jgi:hypothetical protein